MSERTTPKTVFLLAYDDCDQLDITGPYEVLTQAGSMLGDAKQPVPDVRIVSVPGTTADPNGLVRASTGLQFQSQLWTTDDQPDVLIVAGGLLEDQNGNPAGIGKLKDSPPFTERITAQHACGRTVVSICTGAFGVVGAKITAGRHLTSHPGVLDLLAEFAATVNPPGDPVRLVNPDWEARVVDAGDLISCGGVSSGIDEAFYLINAFWGQSLEYQVRSFIDYPYRAHLRTYER